MPDSIRNRMINYDGVFFARLVNRSGISGLTFFFILLISLTPSFAVCQDTLQTVMGRMKPGRPVAIHYKENRYLSLMTDKWSGAGVFYASPPDIMIKDQQLPQKELMAVIGSSYYYFNQESGEKKQGEMTVQDGLAAHIEAFKGLINGDSEYLKTLYSIDFVLKPTGWTITLTNENKAASEVDYKVIMQGLPGQAANKLELLTADGDRSEYLLSPARSGEAVQMRVRQLFELLGAH